MILVRLKENDLGHVEITYMAPDIKTRFKLPKRSEIIKEYAIGRKEEKICEHILRDLKDMRSAGVDQL